MFSEKFEQEKSAFINPDTFLKRIDKLPKTCVGFFSKKLLSEFITQYSPSIVTNLNSAPLAFDVYEVTVNNSKIAVFNALIGAPACAMQVEELFAVGVENLLLVGCCGCLDEKLADFSIIVPTSAIRDEGTSFHYAPPTQEIELDSKIVTLIKNFFSNKNIPYNTGKTWTTDAFFRETATKIANAKKVGAITVEMECASIATIAKFRNKKFGQIFYGADDLSCENYDERSVVKDDNVNKKNNILNLALECAETIDVQIND